MGSWAVQPDDIFSKNMILQAKPFVDRFGLGMARSHPYREGVEENPDYGENSTVNVEFIRELRPRISWAKTFVFLLTIDRESMDRCLLLLWQVHGYVK
jgi:hypothetical protein